VAGVLTVAFFPSVVGIPTVLDVTTAHVARLPVRLQDKPHRLQHDMRWLQGEKLKLEDD